MLSGIGLVVAGAMTLQYYRIPSEGRRKSAFCSTDGGPCSSVLETPQARVFGVPNSLLGIAYYLAMPAAVGLWRFCGARGWLIAAFLATAAGVIFGVYLAHALLFRLRIPCRLCWTSHGINLALLVLLGILSATAD